MLSYGGVAETASGECNGWSWPALAGGNALYGA